MAWTDTCKMDAVAQVNKRKELSGGLRNALRELSKESGIPYGTLSDWYYQINGVPKIRNTSKSDAAKETRKIADLNILTFDSGRKKIVFELRETEGNRLLAIQEYRVAANGKEAHTKNRFTMSIDLIPQFRSALDQAEVLIHDGCSAESGADGSDHKEDHKVESPAGDDGADTQDDAHDDMGIEAAPSPAPVDCPNDPSGEAGLIRCKDCNHLAIQNWDPDGNSACRLSERSWNKKLFQLPNEPHICQNFCGRDQQQG